MMKATVIPHLLHFKRPAGTSRGVYTTRQVWYVCLEEDGRTGVGECAPLPDLSCDARPDYAEVLRRHCDHLEETGQLDREALRDYPSMLFGLETALRQLEAGSLQLWPSAFSEGSAGIPINGLIWMGSFEEMYRRIEEKLSLGFRCVKLKIGAIDFEQELELLRHIRSHFGPEKIELRVDANGAFPPEEAMDKLKQLSKFHLHSIEQPIRAGQWDVMADICAGSPLPVALDEELIGVNRTDEKIRLLDTIRPQYIILKPSLHGGISGCEEWIRLAGQRGIGWWVTSALESNVGLNAIAQWCATLGTTLPQGLGTGQLFTDNIDLPLTIEGDCIRFHPENATVSYPFMSALVRFLGEWSDGRETVSVHTSGSTGRPKEMEVSKERMRASARATVRFLGLKEGDVALLCMPLGFIAGKMVVVRALEAGLRLRAVTPSSHPLAQLEVAPDFAAMTPMQVYCSLQVPREKELLSQVRQLIIGGGPVEAEVANELEGFPHGVWSTYGMTETLSHIALRRLNGPEASDWYTPLSGVSLSLEDGVPAPEAGPGCFRGRLVIDAREVCPEVLRTNDIVILDREGRFRVLGRTDNTVNTGGIKVQIEEVEAALRPYLDFPFMITSTEDPRLGECIVLLGVSPSSDIFGEVGAGELDGMTEAFSRLPAYWKPRRIFMVNQLPTTENGKPDRAGARSMASFLKH